MNEAALLQFLTDNFAGIENFEANGDYYIYYHPDRDQPHDHKFPFATLVTADRHDTFSQLDRPGVYRLNIGVSKGTFQSLFGPEPFHPESATDGTSGYDFAALDRLLPHPVYGNMYWLSVLNPESTWPQVKELFTEAYETAKAKHQ